MSGEQGLRDAERVKRRVLFSAAIPVGYDGFYSSAQVLLLLERLGLVRLSMAALHGGLLCH